MAASPASIDRSVAAAIFAAATSEQPLWRNGRRGRLKICFSQGSGGSSPSRGTSGDSRKVAAPMSENADWLGLGGRVSVVTGGGSGIGVDIASWIGRTAAVLA